MRRPARAAGVVLAALFAGAAAAQSDVNELAAAEKRAADKTLSLREREANADRAIEVRRALIAGAGNDEARLTGWIIDQAGALLARLGRDGADSEVLFGIALPAQREAAAKAAAEAAELLGRAGQRAEATARDLAALGAGPEDPRAAAAEQDRSVRIPFFRARAEAILAALAAGSERSRHAQAAHAAIGKLPLANAGPEAARRVNLAAALLLRATPPEAGDAQTALDECTWVVQAGAAVAPSTRAEAWCGMVQAGVALGRAEQALAALHAALSGPPFVEEGRADALLCVLAADAAIRALWERGVATRERLLLDRAVAEQDALMARADLGLRAQSLRALVFEKLGALPAPDGVAALPPAARLARAIGEARDPARREEALRAFEGVAAAADAGAYAADALWESAVLLTQPAAAGGTAAGAAEHRLQAARLLVRLAREFPAHPRAQEAIGAALAYARALAIESPEQELRASGRAVYAEALEIATTLHTGLANIDLWRYERARLVADPPPGQPAPGEEDLRTALGLLEAIPDGSPVREQADRLYERVQTESLAGLWQRVAALRRSGDEAGVRALASERIAPQARRAAEWARPRAPDAAARFRLDLAEALVDAEQQGARPMFEELLPAAATLPGGEPRLRLGLGRAMVLAGDTAGAFVELRRVAAALDAPVANGPVRPEGFWHAWAIMLELLEQQNADGSRAGAIRAQIKRLRAIDEGLGGEPWRSRIGAVEEKVGR
jgi:hypothetical protein